MEKYPIYYWIDHTAKSPTHTGVQRVTRSLARSLVNNNENIIFVRWDSEQTSVVLSTWDELKHFSSSQGPVLDSIPIVDYPVEGEIRKLHEMPKFETGKGWLLIPEVTHITYHPSPPTLDAILYARHYGLKVAFIFYDAIPLKVPAYAAAAEVQATYMEQIAMADLIIPISQWAANDYEAYLREISCFDDRTLPPIRPVSLSGEIPEVEPIPNITTWNEYASQITLLLDEVSNNPPQTALDRKESIASSQKTQGGSIPNLYSPLLSICVTTYNRAEWLNVSLKQLTHFFLPYSDVVEIVICDNASTDNTEAIAAKYNGLPSFRYYRNRLNVGMLGNLRVTAHHSRGRFVWILGDDDIIRVGALEKILETILKNPSLGLIYLNYAYSLHDAPSRIEDINEFIDSAIPIVPPGEDRYAAIAELATISENFFTAIYCLIFRRDHALLAYSQDIVGRPFSSLLTSIPTSYYICNQMFHEPGYWIGEPCVVVNMNVSWLKYAPLWILDRLPELYALAEKQGANPKELDRWRIHNLKGALPLLQEIYFDDQADNRHYFSFERFVGRHQHLPEFRSQLQKYMKIYRKAYKQGYVRNEDSPSEILNRYNLLEHC